MTTYISEAKANKWADELNATDDEAQYVAVERGDRSYVAVYDSETGEYVGNL
jgi:hypothetical protein